MRQKTVSTVALLALTTLTIAPIVAARAGADEPAPDLPVYSEQIEVFGDRPVIAPVALGEPVSIVFGVGELDIEAAEISQLRAELVLECRKVREEQCGRYKRKLRVEPVRTAEGLEVRMSGLSLRILRRVGVTGRVLVPRWSPLTVDVGIGEVDIQAGDEDLSVRMKIGEITVRVPEEHVHSVSMRTRIGDAGIVLPDRHLEGRRRMLIGARAEWAEGGGDSRVDVKLRIGEARVRLE
ncbi:MAG TPA: hypothetical protein VMT85_15350 [Thermoanaerobaculia bacterium]|nr:hypothetical protein [Thermoanaerobaculia bacterium]